MLDAVVQRLRNSGALHFQRMERVVLRSRVENLVEAFLKSIKGEPSVFMAYLKQIAEDRISEGIFLHETQIVFQILEEKAWQLVVDFVPQVERVRCLSRITGTIGAAKDYLAHIYLQHVEKAELKAAILQHRLDELTQGTDSAPIVDDEFPKNFKRKERRYKTV
jgi:hypothetical protein